MLSKRKWLPVCAQSCPTLCDPMDCSLLGSSVHGIFQARILEWVAILSSSVYSQTRNQQTHSKTCISQRVVMVLWGQGSRAWKSQFLDRLIRSSGSPRRREESGIPKERWVNSVAQRCSNLCNPMDCRLSGLPDYHQLPKFTQTHVHWVGDAIQPSHPLSSPSPPTLNLSQHQGLFKWVSSSLQVAKVLEFQLQHQSFQWIFRTDFL